MICGLSLSAAACSAATSSTARKALSVLRIPPRARRNRGSATPKPAAEGEMLFRGQMLVVKEDDLMVEQCLADLANDLVGERPGKIDAGDFGAERARDPLSGNRVVIHRASSLTATHGRPANLRRYTNSGRVATRPVSPCSGERGTIRFNRTPIAQAA